MPTPAFSFVSTNPFGLTTPGLYAHPTFVDIDGDGDFDAFNGNNSGNTDFFENTGDAGNPAFAGAVSNPFGLADVGVSAAPAFVDIDGDGDFDAFIGNQAGNTFFFENTGDANNPAFAAAVQNPFGLTNVGAFAHPAIVDIDGDGDYDLLIGNNAGNAVFFENTGDANNPAFAAGTQIPFGLGDVGSYSSPAFVDIEGDGDYDALIGNFAGNTTFFENTGDALNPAFSNSGSNLFGLANVTNSAAPTFVDIDGDGDSDAFIGGTVLLTSTQISYFPDTNVPPPPPPPIHAIPALSPTSTLLLVLLLLGVTYWKKWVRPG